MSLTQSIDQAMLVVAVNATTTGARPVSSEQVNAWAKTTGVDYDSLIDQCVDLAEQDNNLSIRAKTIVAKFDAKGRNVARLPYGPILSVTSVVIDGVTIAVSEYELIGDDVVFKFRYTDVVTITYTTGFALLPSGIDLAILKMVLSNFEDRQDNVLEGISHFPSHSRALLKRYKRY
jgi:hypothetical protein